METSDLKQIYKKQRVFSFSNYLLLIAVNNLSQSGNIMKYKLKVTWDKHDVKKQDHFLKWYQQQC